MALNSGIGLEPAVLKGIPANIVNSVRAAAQRTGVDFSYLVAKAAAESSFDPHAKAATSSARGLYQFVNQTWIDMIKEHGADYGLGKLASELKDGSAPQARAQALALRDNAPLSAAMAAEYTRDNQDELESALGRQVGPTELYLAHFLGAQGATKFLTAMDQNASQRADALFPEAARANRSIFYSGGRPRSVAEIYDRFAEKLGLPSDQAGTDNQVAEVPPSVESEPLPSGNLETSPSSSSSAPAFWQGLPRVQTFTPSASVTAALSSADWSSPYSRLSQDAILLLGTLPPPGTRKITS
jgi:hypothetical protein